METPQRDEKLWKLAKERAEFKSSLFYYVVVNAFFWIIWWFTDDRGGTPWPLWSMAGWGLWLGWSYFELYSPNESKMAEKEYEKLKNEK